MKIIILVVLLNLYNFVTGGLVFEGCNKNGWKCTKNKYQKYDIEYSCNSGNNSRPIFYLWNFNAPSDIYGIKISHCKYLQLDLSCSNYNQPINNVIISDVIILNITSLIHPDLSAFPPKVAFNHIGKILHFPKINHQASFPENLYKCNKNSNVTSLIIKNVDFIEEIDSYSINLIHMDTLIIDNVSINTLKPYAINVSMKDYKKFVINDCYIEKIDVKAINYNTNTFLLNNSVIMHIEKSGITGVSHSFYFKNSLVGTVDPDALHVFARNVFIVNNTFGHLLPQALSGISPDLSRNTYNNKDNKSDYVYTFKRNVVYEPNVGSLNPNWEMFENVKNTFTFTKNQLPCSCEELGWLGLVSGFDTGLSSVLKFNKKIMEQKSENLCIDAPCTLTLDVISKVRFNNGVCDPDYNLRMLCNLKINTFPQNKLLDTNFFVDIHNKTGFKRYKRTPDDDEARSRKNRYKVSKTMSNKRDSRKNQRTSVPRPNKPQVDRVTSFPDLNLLDEIHLEDGANHESFEDESDYSSMKGGSKMNKKGGKSKRFTGADLRKNPYKQKILQRIRNKNKSGVNFVDETNLKEGTNHESIEFEENNDFGIPKIDSDGEMISGGKKRNDAEKSGVDSFNSRRDLFNMGVEKAKVGRSGLMSEHRSNNDVEHRFVLDQPNKKDNSDKNLRFLKDELSNMVVESRLDRDQSYGKEINIENKLKSEQSKDFRNENHEEVSSTESHTNFIRKLTDLKNLLDVHNINPNQKKNMLRNVAIKPYNLIKGEMKPDALKGQIVDNLSRTKTNSFNVHVLSPNDETLQFEISEVGARPCEKSRSSKKNKNKHKIRNRIPKKIVWLLSTSKHNLNKNQPIILLPKIISLPNSQEVEDSNEEPFTFLKKIHKEFKKSPTVKNSTKIKTLKNGDIYLQDTKHMFRGEEINLEKYLSTIYGNNTKTLSSKYKYKKFLPITDAKRFFYDSNQNP